MRENISTFPPNLGRGDEATFVLGFWPGPNWSIECSEVIWFDRSLHMRALSAFLELTIH